MSASSFDITGILSLYYAPLSVLILIAIALAFDISNGWHDASNSIATIVSTRVLSPRLAVWWAALFNFLAVFVFGTAVAKTIGKGIIDVAILDYPLICSALVGAITWNILTWHYGLPSSSSHALVGGLAGAGITKAGFSALEWDGIQKTLIFIVASPVMGLILGFIYAVFLARIFRRQTPNSIDRLFRKGQLLSAALYSLGHGGNDAQKTAGIIFGILIASKMLPQSQHEIPFWILLLCHAAMGIGTAFGGWKIVKTMGMKITKLKPHGGFAAETAGATTLAVSSLLGVPVSTTHTVTGAIVGVGATHRLSAVRWGVARRVVLAWVLTIPASAGVSALLWSILHGVGLR
jgi:PiT family inorganic phosphate transporter